MVFQPVGGKRTATTCLKRSLSLWFVPYPVPTVRTFHRVIPALAILTLSAGCSTVLKSEKHLVPAGYQGLVYIVPGVPSGVPVARDGSAQLFVIPSSGILVTQSGGQPQIQRSQFYYFDPEGRQERIEIAPGTVSRTEANAEDLSAVVALVEAGTTSGADFPCAVSYRRYYVGSRAHLLAADLSIDEARFLEFLKQDDRVCSQRQEIAETIGRGRISASP